MSEKTYGQEMLEKLSYKKKNVFEEASSEKITQIFDYSEGYKAYLDASKTEREAVTASIKMAEAAGYTEYKLGDAASSSPRTTTIPALQLTEDTCTSTWSLLLLLPVRRCTFLLPTTLSIWFVHSSAYL